MPIFKLYAPYDEADHVLNIVLNLLTGGTCLEHRGESYAEFDYRPTKCSRDYRVVVVRKTIDVEQGQQRLFNEVRYFFYVTNAKASDPSSRSVIVSANKRCDQENTSRPAYAARRRFALNLRSTNA